MIWGIWLYFSGYIRIEIPTEYYENAVMAFFDVSLTPLRQKKCTSDISYFDFKREDAEIAKRVISQFAESDINLRERGFIHLIKKYRHRAGLLVGAILIILSMMISERFLWNINIKGLEQVSEQKALELLEEHGIYVGCYIPSLDLHTIYNDILIDSDDFSWISVNIRGTVANVEVREVEHPSNIARPNGKCANLISNYDGVITSIKSYGGADVVKVGDSIRAGELLVSGIYEDKMGRVVYGYAQGEVMAKVNREFYVEIPLEYDQKQYTGDQTRDFSIKIFSKTINILNNSRKNDKLYDIIEENEQICLFDRIYLPISYRSTCYNEYTINKKTRDEDTAKIIAYKKIGKDILSVTQNGDIISKEYSGSIEDGVYKLKADVCMNVNIAKVQEFRYSEG